MLEHVTLIITDKSTNEYYVVNNDEVSPSQKGDPLEQIAPKYGAIRGLAYTVGPAMTMGLGSTKDPKQKFHDDAWTRYLASVDWGLHLEIPPDVKKLEKSDPEAFAQKALAIQKVRYEKFYADQEAFDREIKKLDPLVDALAPDRWRSGEACSRIGPRGGHGWIARGPLHPDRSERRRGCRLCQITGTPPSKVAVPFHDGAGSICASARSASRSPSCTSRRWAERPPRSRRQLRSSA